MSFKTNYSDVIICNRALSLLPEEEISTMDAPGLAARKCRQHYSSVVRRVLTMHDWGMATKTESLAVSGTNPRNEWLFAYEEPNDLAFAIDVVPPETGAATTNYFRAQVALGSSLTKRFSRTDGMIYTNIEDARLVYTTLDITEDQFTEEFVEVLEKYLAAKLAMPITKRADLAKDLGDEGDKLANRAIAQYRAQQNQTWGDEISETELVRQGLPMRPTAYGNY